MPFDPRRGQVSGGPAQTPIEFDGLGGGNDVHAGPATPPIELPPIEPTSPNTPPPPPPPPDGGTGGGGGSVVPNQGAQTLPSDLIGDIPPPPVPAPPIHGPGVAGLPGTEAGTFARPGSRGVLPLHTAAFTNKRPQRFGPGTPVVGGAASLTAEAGLGISPEAAAELLRRLAAGNAQG